MSSYTLFAMPTYRQATIQMYRVCKCAEDWRQQRSSVLVKRQQQSSVLVKRQQQSSALHILVVSIQSFCFNAQPSSNKLNTFVLWLAYKWA